MNKEMSEREAFEAWLVFKDAFIRAVKDYFSPLVRVWKWVVKAILNQGSKDETKR